MAMRPEPQFKHGGVAEILERRVAKGWQEEMLDEFVAKLAASAVAHHDRGIVGEWQRTTPVRKIGRAGFFSPDTFSHWLLRSVRFLREQDLPPTENGHS